MNRQTFLILLSLIIFSIFGITAVAQDCPDCPAPESEVTLYYDENIITLYIPEGIASLIGINFETIIDGTPRYIDLEDYPNFSAVNLAEINAPYCLRLQISGTSPQAPQICENLQVSNQTIQEIPQSENFWFDYSSNQMRNLIVKQLEYELESCNSTNPICSIGVPPLADTLFAECSSVVTCELILGSEASNTEQFSFQGEGGVYSSELSSECALFGSYGLAIDYNMPLGGYGGWGTNWNYTPNQSFNASNSDMLTFWIKTETVSNFQIGLKDILGNEEKVDLNSWVIVRNGVWNLVVLPLNRFSIVDLSQIENISIGVNQDHGEGSFCLDNIAFAQEGLTIANATINLRSAPYTSAPVIEQINEQRDILILATGIIGSEVNGNSNWILALYNHRYIYIHSSSVILSEEPPTPTPPPPLTTAMIASFDNDMNAGEIGCEMGIFSPDPNNLEISDTYSNGELILAYNIASFAGFWIQLCNADFSNYSHLVFAINGSDEFDIKIELKSGSGQIESIYRTVPTNNEVMSIALAEFGLTDLSNVTEIVFVIEDQKLDVGNANRQGQVVLDDIQVTTSGIDNVSETTQAIATFDNGTNVNELGCEMGIFSPDPNNPEISDTYSNGELILDYNIASFAGFWIQLCNTDFSNYERVSFDIEASDNFRLKVEFKNNNGDIQTTYIDVLTSRQPINITLDSLGLSSLENMSEIVFVLESQELSDAGASPSGQIIIDNIVLR